MPVRVRQGLVLLSLLACIYFSIVYPHPRRVDDEARVDLSRLRSDLSTIADRPRETGNPRLAEVRQYLVSQLERAGVEPKVQRSLAVDRYGRLVTLSNIVATVPGRDPSRKPILLATHYDSRRNSPGAGDAGMAVASALETVRFLVADPPLRPVIVLLTDGEESGLLGAKAWVSRHEGDMPAWTVLNFDARGNRGPVVMYEASGYTKTLVDRVFDELPAPAGNSAAAFVYERMRNRTDFTVFAAADMQGLNFAVIDGYRHYHTKTDTTERVTDAMLSRYAETMRVATTELANLAAPTIDVPASRVNRASAYFTIGPFVLAYSMPRAVMLVLAIGFALVVALRTARPRRVGWRLVQITLSLLGACFPAALLLGIDRGKTWHDWTAVAFAVAVLHVAFVSSAARLSHRRDRAGFLLPIAIVLSVAGIATTLYDIRLSFLVTWLALLTSIALLSGRWWSTLIAAAGSTLVMLPMLWLATLALTMQMLVAVMPGLLLLGWLWQLAWASASVRGYLPGVPSATSAASPA